MKNYSNIKKIKYLGINLIKATQDLYTEKYKTLKEMKDELNKWKGMPYFQIG
jgi:hypothetical protein